MPVNSEVVKALLSILLFIVAGEICVIFVLAGILRKLIISITDARANEKDSPLGAHKDDARAHEPMRDALLEKINERLDDFDQRLSKSTERILEQNERLMAELSRLVDSPRNSIPSTSSTLVPRRV